MYEAMSKAGEPFTLATGTHVMPDSYMFDTQYHLNKNGVDSLTTLLIKEFRSLGIGDGN